MPLDVDIVDPYWQEAWNLIFLDNMIQNLLVATKIEKNEKIEESILKKPQQYLWHHRRFKSQYPEIYE